MLAIAAISISQEKKTVLLDLHRWSMWYIEKIESNGAHRLNKSPTDYTHLNENGKTSFGR
jgi:hypothetical protein